MRDFVPVWGILLLFVHLAAPAAAGDAAATCIPLAPGSQTGEPSPSLTIETHGNVWSIWEDGQLRWRATLPATEIGADSWPRSRPDTLDFIATWLCPGDVTAGGLMDAWDLNDNGQYDLCYSNWGSMSYVYAAAGDDDFEQVHQYPNPYGSYYTRFMCAGDGDSDGLAEMVFTSGRGEDPGELFFVESRHSGAYPDTISLILPEENIGSSHVRMADLDGDGLRECVSASQGYNEMLLAIWENRGDNEYTQVFATHFGGDRTVSGEIAPGDFDGDGQGDLVVPENEAGASMLHIFESTGDDAYAEVWSADVPTENVYWVTPGPDLDRDGRGDFVITGGVGLVNPLWSFLMYESTGNDSYEIVWSHQTNSSMLYGGSVTGDIDGDRQRELLCQVPDHTMLFRVVGDNALELVWSLDGPVLGQAGHRLLAPDLDGDFKGEATWWIADEPGQLVLYEWTGQPMGVCAEEDSPGLLRFVNPLTTDSAIHYTLATGCVVTLEVVDVLGRSVMRRASTRQAAGNHAVSWDASAPAGVYFCRLRASNREAVRKLVVTR